MAVTALRGELDPPAWVEVRRDQGCWLYAPITPPAHTHTLARAACGTRHTTQNSERTPSVLLAALVQFPTRHCFSVVGANVPGLQGDVVGLIAGVCQVPVGEVDVKASERLNGKFLSLQVRCASRMLWGVDVQGAAGSGGKDRAVAQGRARASEA